MASFLFYDPGRKHRSSVGSDILFFRCPHCLYDTVSTYNDIQHLVCVCCSDPSTIIEQLEQKQQGLLIHLCNEQHGSDHNLDLACHHNVRGDLVFDFKDNWEVEGRTALLAACKTKNYSVQASAEFEKLCKILKLESDELRSSVPAEGQQEDVPSNSSNESDKSAGTK